MRVFSAGFERSRVHSASEKASLLLADMRSVGDGGARALARLRDAADDRNLPRGGSVRGPLQGDATPLRGFAPMAVAFFGLRRALDATQLVRGDVRPND